MSVKSKRRERRKKAAQASPDAKATANAGAEEEETYSLNSILADFRANKELEQAAEGIKPVKGADFDDFSDMPAPERVAETPAPETLSGVAEPIGAAETLTAGEGAETLFESTPETPEKAFRFASEEAAERAFRFASEEATETPFRFATEEAAEKAFSFATEEATETPSRFASDEAIETPFGFSATEGAETPPDASATQAAQAPFSLTAEEGAEAPFDLTKAASAMDSAGRGSDAPELPDAAPLSDTRIFSGVEAAAQEADTPAPTLWSRIFKHPKKDDAKESKEDGEPKSISLEEVVGSTVDAVKADAILQGASGKRSLFSRRRLEDMADELPGTHPEIIGPEPDLKTAAAQARREYVRRVEGLLPAIVPAVLPTLALLLEAFGVRLPLLTGSVIARPLSLLACLGATLWLCRSVFMDNPCGATFLCGVSAAASALDCLTMPFLSGRSMAEPYGAVACLALLSAKAGSSLESRGVYDAFHAAGLDRNPPYLVTDSVNGARKQRGAVTGFYTATLAQNFSNRWQTFVLPVTLAASLAFAALSSVGQEGRWSDFFLNWSAILAAGATLVLPLCWGLPWARLAARLKNAGCAIAGWRGAEQLARKRKMVVTDSDLFPPGSVRLEDMRVYGEEPQAVVSIAASMVKESGCGLERIFEDLLAAESGEYLPVRDFHFYEDGGFSGTIQEEKVLLGTSSFLRKMSVRFPGDFYFPVGLYLAVNGELAATFALKYEAPENVDFALRLMRRNHVTAILAARDPNLTPKLLQRVFRRKIDVDYPGLNNRIALSAMRAERHIPRALLFREGLQPYAETVVGSLRLRAGVRRSTALALFGSAVGTLLAFYLVYQAKYYLFSPLNLLLFLLLWTAPAILLMDLY